MNLRVRLREEKERMEVRYHDYEQIESECETLREIVGNLKKENKEKGENVEMVEGAYSRYRMETRGEMGKLKEENEKIKEKINKLKKEKNEIDEDNDKNKRTLESITNELEIEKEKVLFLKLI